MTAPEGDPVTAQWLASFDRRLSSGLAQIRDSQAEMRRELLERMDEHREESRSEQISTRALVNDLVIQDRQRNGRIGKLEKARDESLAVASAVARQTKLRIDRFRFWLAVSISLVSAFVGSTIYFVMTHLH